MNRFKELIAKQAAGTLSEAEVKELAALEKTLEDGSDPQISASKKELQAAIKEANAGMAKDIEALEKKLDKVSEKALYPTKSLQDEADAKKDDSIKSFAEFMRAYKANDRVAMKASIVDAQAKGLTEGTESEGGFLVPTEFHREVLRTVEQYGVARKLFRAIPMGTDKKDITALTGEPVAYRVGEASAAPSASTLTFGQLQLIAKKTICNVIGTSELVEDNQADIAIWNLVIERVAQAFALLEDTQFFTGNGTGNNDLGLFASTNGDLTDFVIAGSTFATVTADELLDMQFSVAGSIRARGKYLLHPTVFASIRKLKGSDGHYIYEAPNGTTPATIWGKPFELSEVVPATSDGSQGGTRFASFGDHNLAGVIGDRRNMTVKRLTEGTVNGVNLADTDQEALQTTSRSGYATVFGKAIVFAKTAA